MQLAQCLVIFADMSIVLNIRQQGLYFLLGLFENDWQLLDQIEDLFFKLLLRIDALTFAPFCVFKFKSCDAALKRSYLCIVLLNLFVKGLNVFFQCRLVERGDVLHSLCHLSAFQIILFI